MNPESQRKIILNIEATGASVDDGHRIIELAAVELIDGRFTYRTYRSLLNPEYPINEGAEAVHGISEEMLEGAPSFGEIAAEHDAVWAEFGHEDIGAVNYSGSYDFVANGFASTSMVFGIGAIWDAVYQSCYRRWGHDYCKNYTAFDSFKLYSVTVETGPFGGPPEIPLPAGVILMLSGLAGLGFLKRFKSKAAT